MSDAAPDDLPPVPGIIDQLLQAMTARREIDEGVLLAEYAVRMAVKNRIVVETIGDGSRFDPDHAALHVRAQLGELQREALENASRMSDLRRTAAGGVGRAVSEHDYRPDDQGNLRRRRRVYSAVARRLRAAQQDDTEVERLVESARSDAWAEIGAEIRRGLANRPTPVQRAELSPDERAMQRELLVAMDLTMLAAERGIDLHELD